MKLLSKISLSIFLIVALSCHKNEEAFESELSNSAKSTNSKSSNFHVNFQYKSTIKVGGEGASEISAFDSKNNKLFVVNVASTQVSVFDISDINNPIEEAPIAISLGSPNSIAVSKGRLAIALEAEVKQDPGFILLYDTKSLTLLQSYQVGALPDMVAFSPNGKFIISANEGEPDDLYLNDPKGTISIIDLESNTISTLDFEPFNTMQASLEANGFRVFGPNATLAQDVEPEYVAVSNNSETAWVTLQENNGVAKVNLLTKSIEAIYPLGYKDFNAAGNEIDPSDKDGVKALGNVPVYGIYQPDAIAYVKIRGVDYIITANEGDARDYDGFSEEERVADLILDPSIFPNREELQKDENIGRLKITTTLGDLDGDGDYDAIYNYGARSFTIWTGNGNMVYDSGNSIATETLSATPTRFNDNDKRSDDKGAEPETVEVLNIQGNKHILFVGLERNDQVLVYDISNPASPKFLQILSHAGDEAPEGLLAISEKDSPNGKDLLLVSNEDSGTVSIYENK
ncbi:choice-of-anchor I family protein [uncultured Algibacter sp.]|uniref:choice-of-anchor I family protein n=1 Tax=uncultured Algibacter sp. TaxID=298659 RepID=UPI002604BEDF|nr:choice-of-anchor I family protein [uncultured Algibacter sp.]